MVRIAVIGSITRDRIIIKSQNRDFNQPGGGVYYCSHALVSLGAEVFAFPLLAKKDDDLLEALNRPGIQVFPQWTEETTCYQNRYFGNTLDQCEKKCLSQAKNFYPSEDFWKKIQNCDAIHLVPLYSISNI